MVEKKEENKEYVEIISVPTQTAPAMRLDNGAIITDVWEALALILNKLNKIEKSVA